VVFVLDDILADFPTGGRVLYTVDDSGCGADFKVVGEYKEVRHLDGEWSFSSPGIE